MVVTSCHFSDFWNSWKFKFLLQFLLKLFLLLQVLTWFYKKNPKTPLRNRKFHPELLRRWFQDHLKIDILQQNWSQKLSLWPKIHFFLYLCLALMLTEHPIGLGMPLFFRISEVKGDLLHFFPKNSNFLAKNCKKWVFNVKFFSSFFSLIL